MRPVSASPYRRGKGVSTNIYIYSFIYYSQFFLHFRLNGIPSSYHRGGYVYYVEGNYFLNIDHIYHSPRRSNDNLSPSLQSFTLFPLTSSTIGTNYLNIIRFPKPEQFMRIIKKLKKYQPYHNILLGANLHFLHPYYSIPCVLETE